MEVSKVAQLIGHSGAIYCLAHYKENRFFSGGFDNLLVEWDIAQPDTAIAVAKLKSKAISLLFLKDRNWLIAGQSTGGVHIIDLACRKEIHLLQAHSDMIFALYFDVNESHLYVGAGDGKISVWCLKTMNCLVDQQLGVGKVRDIKLFNNELYLGVESGDILILSKKLNKIGLISEHQKGFSVNSLLFHDKILLSGSRDGHINHHRFNGTNFVLGQRIPAHNYAIYKIVPSPDKSYIATASRDRSIKIWNLVDMSFEKKIEFKENQGHQGSVNDLIWVENYLISVSDDRSVIVWEIKL